MDSYMNYASIIILSLSFIALIIMIADNMKRWFHDDYHYKWNEYNNKEDKDKA